MNFIIRSVIILCLLPVCASCSISDEERCSGDFYYEEGSCYPEAMANPGTTPAPASDSGVADGGTTGTVTGLGEPCSDQPACAQYQANYCMLDPTNPEKMGICSVIDCTTQPDNCPANYTCCDFPPLADGFYNGYNICLPDAEIQEVLDVLGSCDG